MEDNFLIYLAEVFGGWVEKDVHYYFAEYRVLLRRLNLL